MSGTHENIRSDESEYIDYLLDEFRILQGQLELGIPCEELREELEAYTLELAPIIENRPLILHGKCIVVPHLDEYGHVMGSIFTDGNVEGTFNRVVCSTVHETPQLGMIVHTGKPIVYQTLVEDTFVQHKTFVPFADMNLSFGLEDDTPFIPDDSDEMAQDIDEIIFGDKFNLGGLNEYIMLRFGEISDLQIECYQNYLNQLFDFETITLQAERVLVINGDSLEVITDADTGTEIYSGNFLGIVILNTPAGEDDNSSVPVLAINMHDEDLDLKMAVLVQDIEDIEFNT